MSDKTSIELYNQLLLLSAPIKEIIENLPTYENQIKFEQLNVQCYKVMFSDLRQKDFIPRLELFPMIPGLKEECSKCWSFFIYKRTSSKKKLDIHLGKKYEEVFMEFLRTKDLLVERGDLQNRHYPDILVSDKEQNPIVYLEFKNSTAPFLMIYKKVGGRECYEGSLTLDSAKKLEAQLTIIQNEITVPVFYVYWVDYPCLKGIFAISSDKVQKLHAENESMYERKMRSGDINEKGRKVGTTKKIYLSVLNMLSFTDLMEEIAKLAP
ncbi:MAG: hypothetical protein ACTSXD_06780 [Candidatus Heimdallarchaeaceae archaeon]